MKRQVIYIAGPYRAKGVRTVLENIRAAEAYAIQITALGHYHYCPHLNAAFFDGIAPDEHWLAHGLEMLRRCDAVVLLPGWKDSTGTLQEVADAQLLGLTIYDSINHVPFADEEDAA